MDFVFGLGWLEKRRHGFFCEDGAYIMVVGSSTYTLEVGRSAWLQYSGNRIRQILFGMELGWVTKGTRGAKPVHNGVNGSWEAGELFTHLSWGRDDGASHVTSRLVELQKSQFQDDQETLRLYLSDT